MSSTFQLLKILHLSFATTSAAIFSPGLSPAFSFFSLLHPHHSYIWPRLLVVIFFLQVSFLPLLDLHKPLGLPDAVRDEKLKMGEKKSDIFLIIHHKSLSLDLALRNFQAGSLSGSTRNPRYSPVAGRSQRCQLITQPTRKAAASSQNMSNEKNNKRRSSRIGS